MPDDSATVERSDMTIAAQKRKDEQEATDDLRELLAPGDTVYTVLRHVSRSGMYRAIDLYVIRDGEPRRITHTASRLLEGYDNRHEAAKANGCGMDMGFHLVYSLSSVLFKDGFDCIGKASEQYPDYIEGCPSNDHSNRRFFEERGEAVPTHHRDGGYALKHRWL